jgi:hypothetical protein
MNRKKQAEVLEWTSAIPYRKHHEETRIKILNGTGGWLFRHPGFDNWRNWGNSEILWLHGSAGTGKSTLLSVTRSEQMRIANADFLLVHLLSNR